MTSLKRSRFLLAISLTLLAWSGMAAETILMFVSHEDTYYSEYIVMKKALEAAGYTVEVRSASSMDFSVYMEPSNTDIAETAGTLPGGSYSQFQAQFQSLFGSAWDGSVNAIPGLLPVDGAILDVVDMSAYAGMVMAGGTGALDYRVDGGYSSQGAGERLLSAEVVQAVAEKLNELALVALAQGKPVMAQCHGASLPTFWRIPGTSGTGMEALGYSLLKDQGATGFPETDTETTLAGLNVIYRSADRVTVSGVHTAFGGAAAAKSRVITTRDWYPQTVAFAARTFLNILETYPSAQDLESEVSVLVVHGGALDESNCTAANKENDVPCNYGGGENLPADYTDLLATLETEEFNFVVEDVNLSDVGSLPFTASDKASVKSYLEGYDVVVFFKHWSTYITDEFLQAIADYVDDGHGLIGLHHALYNDIHDGQSKDLLAEVFGAESSAAGWSANLTTYDIYAANYGHFVATYGVDYTTSLSAPELWNDNGLPAPANTGFSTLPSFSVYDEIYNNMAFLPGVTFGRLANQVMPLFSNGMAPAGQGHTTGFTRVYNANEDELAGHVVFLQVGERKENISSGSTVGQIIRNAAMWAAGLSGGSPANPDVVLSSGTKPGAPGLFPNPAHDIIMASGPEVSRMVVYDMAGREQETHFADGKLIIRHLAPGTYVARLYGRDGQLISNQKFIRK